MNTQGETWTAERSITFLIESRLFSELNAPSIVDGLRTALAIVRLHPALMKALEDCCSFNDRFKDLLARAHALGEKR